jgi:hypothetical protein
VVVVSVSVEQEEKMISQRQKQQVMNDGGVQGEVREGDQARGVVFEVQGGLQRDAAVVGADGGEAGAANDLQPQRRRRRNLCQPERTC